MANEHGRLPKADPASLDPALRRRLEVWLAKAYRDDNLFLTLARRPAVLGSSLDPGMLELCRVRLAQKNRCVH